MISPGNQPSDVNTGHTLTRVGSVLFMATYACLFAMHVILWGRRQHIPTHHRTVSVPHTSVSLLMIFTRLTYHLVQLLAGVSLALPPLFVRIVYSLLSSFASSSQSRWSPISGDWRIYLTMGLIMEYLVVCVYVITGALTPLHKDDEVQARGGVPYQASEDGLEMGKRFHAPS
jgi:hypothetical protein